MSLDCVITVDGKDKGLGGNSRPKHSKTKPVSDFLRDSYVYYRAVFKHLKSCGKCDPQEALEGFLKNRAGKQRGLTSGMLVKMAERYRKAFPDRVSEKIVKEFTIRSLNSWSSFELRADGLSEQEIVRAHDIGVEAWKESTRKNLIEVKRYIARSDHNKIESLFRTEELFPFHKLQEHLGLLIPYVGQKLILAICRDKLHSSEALLDHLPEYRRRIIWKVAVEGRPRVQQILKLIVSHSEETASQNNDPQVAEYMNLYSVWSVLAS